jgi:hypothetical protein
MLDIFAELAKREMIKPNILQVASGETIPVIKKPLVELPKGGVH